MTSGQRYFRTIAIILLFYVILLCFFYPAIVEDGDFDNDFIVILVLVLSFSSFVQYYFGIVDNILLAADQKGYIVYFSTIVTIIVNTVACSAFINLGASITFVKASTAIIFFIRPVVIRLYINKHYDINRRYKYDEEPIKQKWNGLAQHIASVILNDTDTIVLTTFSTLENVSVYGVYNMIVVGVKQLIISLQNAILPVLGELLAKKRTDEATSFFSIVEFGLHAIVVFLFSCTSVLIIPFVSIYTTGVNDANYINVPFAALIVMAHAFHCLRMPYNIMVLAAGKYRETQNNYIIAAILNICISVALVFPLGLLGVAIGTLVSMLYQTIWLAVFNSKNIIYWPIKKFLKQCIFDIISCLLIVIISRFITLNTLTYLSWVVMSIKVLIVSIVVMCITTFLFYQENARQIYKYIKHRMKK